MASELALVIGIQAFSALCIALGGLFVLTRDTRGKLNRLFAFIALATVFDTVVTIISELQTTYAGAYFWWTANVEQVFIAIAVTHFILAVAGRDRSWRPFIILTYAVGLAFIMTTIVEPSWFQATVVPKLYFHYYLNGSWLYDLMLAYFFAFPLVALANLVDVYRHARGVTRARYEYVVLAVLVGYGIGALNFPIVYDVNVDPVFGTLLNLYLVPIGYGIFSADLLDIRIVAKRALYLGIIVAGVAAFLASIPLIDDLLQATHPGLNRFVLPPLVAVFASGVGWIVWRQATEAERLKNEFITVAAHKLRTPLTRIRWAAAALKEKSGSDAEVAAALSTIDAATDNLIELTSILMEASHTGDASYGYEKKPVDLNALAADAVRRFTGEAAEKRITLSLAANGSTVIGDERRIKSVIDVLLENAVAYTPEGGTVAVEVSVDRFGVHFSVRDSGIGIAPEDRKRIFKSFFRTHEAQTADTEGFGLGLSLAKGFIERQHGSIGFDSPGEGQGSTFWFTLPAQA